MVLILYFVFSRQSSPLIKRIALAALALIALSILASLFVIIGKPPDTVGVPSGNIPVEPAAAVQPANLIATIVLGISMLLFLVMIVILALRENRRFSRNSPDS
jgi:hypothetical protein